MRCSCSAGSGMGFRGSAALPTAYPSTRTEVLAWDDNGESQAAILRTGRLHLVAAEVVFAQALEVLTQVVAGDAVSHVGGLLAVLQHLVLDEDRAVRSEEHT